MDAPDFDSPPLPSERAAPSSVALAMRVILCGVAMLAVLYVGSFAVLMANAQYGLGLYPSFDPATDQRISDALVTLYWPLIQMWFAFLEIG